MSPVPAPALPIIYTAVLSGWESEKVTDSWWAALPEMSSESIVLEDFSDKEEEKEYKRYEAEVLALFGDFFY